jgi:hypothetical protein
MKGVSKRAFFCGPGVFQGVSRELREFGVISGVSISIKGFGCWAEVVRLLSSDAALDGSGKSSDQNSLVYSDSPEESSPGFMMSKGLMYVFGGFSDFRKDLQSFMRKIHSALKMTDSRFLLNTSQNIDAGQKGS